MAKVPSRTATVAPIPEPSRPIPQPALDDREMSRRLILAVKRATPHQAVMIAELNAVDRLGDRAKENPNSAYQGQSENNHGEDGPEWRGAAPIPLRSNHEVDCGAHG